MKILLDENLPKKLKIEFGPDYDVSTVVEKGWNGKKNGELLGLMVINGFEGFVTIDKNLQYQQHLAKFSIRLFILDAENNKIDTLKPYIQRLKDVLLENKLDQISIIKLH